MANLRLRQSMLEVVDNQLRDGDPQCTTEAYERLQEMGYSKTEAKTTIASVVTENMYHMMKEVRPFQEEIFKSRLEELVRSMPQKADISWNPLIRLVEKGQECLDANDYPGMTKAWMEAWESMKLLIVPMGRIHVEELTEHTGYAYDLENWLTDMEMELGNAKEYEKCIRFCQEAVEYLEFGNLNEGNMKRAVADSYMYLGDIEKCDELYQNWVCEQPDDSNLIYGWIYNLRIRGEVERALQLVTQAVEVEGKHDIELLVAGEGLFTSAGNLEKTREYQERINTEEERRVREGEYKEMLWERGWVSEPIVKDKKIYPNDPCSCGSGKKYKKCCGRGK